jgi:glutamine synthetase type III
MKYLTDLKESLTSFIEDEFRDSADIKSALMNVLRDLEELDNAIDGTKDDSVEKVEARKILREKIDKLPIFAKLNDKEKDLVANLAIKYEKEIPSEEEFRENIYRRIMNLSNDTVIILAYGKSSIIQLGKSLGAKSDEVALKRGLEALHREAYLPQNIESTYAKAIDNIYEHKDLFMAFLIDYFRNVK